MPTDRRQLIILVDRARQRGHGRQRAVGGDLLVRRTTRLRHGRAQGRQLEGRARAGRVRRKAPIRVDRAARAHRRIDRILVRRVRGGARVRYLLQLPHQERGAVRSELVARRARAQPRLEKVLKVAARRERVEAQREQDPALDDAITVGREKMNETARTREIPWQRE